MRREQLNRHRSDESRRPNMELKKGRTTDYDADKPWDYLFRLVVKDATFWDDQLKEPCIMVCARVRPVGSFLLGDSVAASSSAGHLATYGALGQMEMEARGVKRAAATLLVTDN